MPHRKSVLPISSTQWLSLGESASVTRVSLDYLGFLFVHHTSATARPTSHAFIRSKDKPCLQHIF